MSSCCLLAETARAQSEPSAHQPSAHQPSRRRLSWREEAWAWPRRAEGLRRRGCHVRAAALHPLHVVQQLHVLVGAEVDAEGVAVGQVLLVDQLEPHLEERLGRAAAARRKRGLGAPAARLARLGADGGAARARALARGAHLAHAEVAAARAVAHVDVPGRVGIGSGVVTGNVGWGMAVGIMAIGLTRRAHPLYAM